MHDYDAARVSEGEQSLIVTVVDKKHGCLSLCGSGRTKDSSLCVGAESTHNKFARTFVSLFLSSLGAPLVPNAWRDS